MSLWLAKDQRSNEVVALQNALNVRLKPPKLLVLDGIFGPLTEGAVREFQKCEGLKSDGIAGPHTLGELFVRRTMVLELVLSSDPLSAAEEKVAARGTASRRSARRTIDPRCHRRIRRCCRSKSDGALGWPRQLQNRNCLLCVRSCHRSSWRQRR
jgi:Putative peptidoglycan binding domain